MMNLEGISFRNLETRLWFFAERTEDPWALSQGLTHVVSLAGGTERRFCRFSPKLTRCYVAVDEGAAAEAILQTWKIAVG